VGTALLDVHRSGDVPLAYALPPRDRYRIRVESGEFVVSASELGGPFPEPVPSEIAQRGEAESLLRGLYAVPFDRSFYEGYMVSTSDLVPVEFHAEAPPPPPRGFLRTGTFMVGLSVTGAPLGGSGVGGSVGLAWRSSPPWTLGLRVAYGYAPSSFADSSTVHQLSVMALGGWSGQTRWAPFVEAGVGWLLTIVPREGQTQGDPTGWVTRAATGLQIRSLPVGVRFELALELQSVRVDSSRTYNAIPSLEIAAVF